MSNVNFDGFTLKYSDDVYINCIYDEEYREYTFDIYHHGDCDEGYCILEQAHNRALGYLK